jgi:hypothetical protein
MSTESQDNQETSPPPETNIRVGFGIHSGSPDRWGWEISSKNGYSWGTEQSERQAMLECIAYMTANLL